MNVDVVLHLDLFQAYSSRSFVEMSDSEDDDNDSLLSLQELRWELLLLNNFHTLDPSITWSSTTSKAKHVRLHARIKVVAHKGSP